MPHILVIRHGPGDRAQLGVFADALDAANVTWDSVESSAGAPVPDALGERHAGLIVLGGSMYVREQGKFPFLTREIALLHRSVEENRPVLGICLGAQLLAAALGAPVYQAPQLEVGWQNVALAPLASDDLLFGGLPGEIPAFHWHSDRFDLPTGALPLASSALTPNQAFRYGKSAWGIQFHPEVTNETIRRWIVEDAETAEAEAAGTSAAQIEADTACRLPNQTALAHTLVERWVGLL